MSDDSDNKPGQDPLSQLITSPPKESSEKKDEELESSQANPEEMAESESNQENSEDSPFTSRVPSGGSSVPIGTVAKVTAVCVVLALLIVVLSKLLTESEVIQKVEEKIDRTVNKEKREAEDNQQYLRSSIQIGMDRKADAKNSHYLGGNQGAIPQIVIASLNCQLPRVNELIASGADIDAPDKNGETALSWAAKGGCLPVVKSLVAAGADVNLKSKQGKTALDWANSKNLKEIADILKMSGSN